VKKSIIIGSIVTLVIGLIAAIPVFAKSQPADCRAVFEADMFDFSPTDGCVVEKGEAWIREDGSFKIEIEGEILAGTYYIWLYDLSDYDFIQIDEITLSEDTDVLLSTGYLYDAGISDTNIAPVIEIFSDSYWESMSGCYVPPAP
jgi:hypothetical protein